MMWIDRPMLRLHLSGLDDCGVCVRCGSPLRHKVTGHREAWRSRVLCDEWVVCRRCHDMECLELPLPSDR